MQQMQIILQYVHENYRGYKDILEIKRCGERVRGPQGPLVLTRNKEMSDLLEQQGTSSHPGILDTEDTLVTVFKGLVKPTNW